MRFLALGSSPVRLEYVATFKNWPHPITGKAVFSFDRWGGSLSIAYSLKVPKNYFLGRFSR